MVDGIHCIVRSSMDPLYLLNLVLFTPKDGEVSCTYPGIRIGARIAVAAGLVKSKFEHLMVNHSVEGLDVWNVMRRILDLRFQQSTRSVEAVIIHLDEHQIYIRDDERGEHQRTWNMARERFKEMLKQIGNLMR